MLFIFIGINLNAQTTYNCYHLQEYLWNTETQVYDVPVEKNDNSIFYFDDEKKIIQQANKDGLTSRLIFNSITIDDLNKTTTYQVKSPANGYSYLYIINFKSSSIEIYLNKNNQPTLLKKYLFKN